MLPVSVSGVLLLFLIHHSTLNSVNGEDIDQNTLARIITFFEQNYKRVHERGNPLQYAVAINVPKVQCEAGFQPSVDNFLTKENPADVKSAIVNKEYPVYHKDTDLIAAGVQEMPEYMIHSERLLLNRPPDRPVTHMQDLLNRRTEDSCTILYSFNSPCSKTCLNVNSPDNVLTGIKEWSKHISIKALVFKQIFSGESPDTLRNALQQIANYVPLYRCKNNNECFSCGGTDDKVPINEECLTN